MRENKLDILLAASQMVDAGADDKLPHPPEAAADEAKEREQTADVETPASKTKNTTKVIHLFCVWQVSSYSLLEMVIFDSDMFAYCFLFVFIVLLFFISGVR